MAPRLYPPERPQSVGEILDSALRIFRATLLRCLPYAAVAVIAGELPDIWYLGQGHPALSELADWRTALLRQLCDPEWWLLEVIGSVAVLVLWGAIVLHQHAVASGKASSAREELVMGMRRAGQLFLAVILTGLAVAACFLPALVLRGAWLLIAALVLMIPASYVAIALSCTWTVLLVSGQGALASMVQSWRMTSGSFWRLSVVYTAGAALLLMLGVLASVIAAVLSVFLAAGNPAAIAAADTVVVVAVAALATAFGWALALAVLGDLGTRCKEQLTPPAQGAPPGAPAAAPR